MMSLRVLLAVLALLASLLSVAAQTSTVNFCYTSSSYPNSPYGPWTIVVSGTLTINSTSFIPSLSLAPVTAGGGRPGNLVVAAAATRTQTNRDGSVSTATLNLCTAGVQGSDQIVYKSAPFTDWNGFCLNVTSASDLADGQPGWLVNPNGFPSRAIEIYHDLPSQSYPNIYHSDEPFNPYLNISASTISCVAPSTAPQTQPATTQYSFCYQAYGTASGLPWSSSIGGVIKTLSTTGLTASSALGLTAATYGQYVLSATGTRLQQIGTNGSTTNPIVGLSWIHPGGLDGNDGLPDPYLLPSKPHLTGYCPTPSNSSATCFGGLVLYAANAFYFPNNVETIDSYYAQVNAIDLRHVNGAIIEANSAAPTYSNFAVAAGSSAPSCPLITSSASVSTLDASPLFTVTTGTRMTLSFGYWLNSNGINLNTSVPYSGNGFWSVAFSGILTVIAGTANYSGAANAANYSTAYLVVGATGERVFTDAIGRTTVSQITGVVAPQFVYNAGSALSVPLNNDNLVYVSPTTSSGYGYGGLTVDTLGLAFTVTAPASAALGSAGLPGFPNTARFNSFPYLKISTGAGSTTANGLFETVYGPILIDGAIAAPDSYAAETGLAYTAYTTSLGVQLFPGLQPAARLAGGGVLCLHHGRPVLHPLPGRDGAERHVEHRRVGAGLHQPAGHQRALRLQQRQRLGRAQGADPLRADRADAHLH